MLALKSGSLFPSSMELFEVMDDSMKFSAACTKVSMIIPTTDLIVDESGKTTLEFSQVDPDCNMVRTNVSLPFERAQELVETCRDAKSEVEKMFNLDSGQIFWDVENGSLIVHKIWVRFTPPKNLGFSGEKTYPDVLVQFRVPTKATYIVTMIDYRSMLNLMGLVFARVFVTG